MPTLGVVVPTYNRIGTLRRVLEGLAAQTAPMEDVEIVVVSDGSCDGTDSYLSSGRTPLPLRFVRQSNRGPGAARNYGASLSRGDILLFIDDDVVPRPQLVAEHLYAHAREGPGTVVLGPMLTPSEHVMSPWVQYEQAMLYKQYAAMSAGQWSPTARQFYTGNASLERRRFISVGGFDESLRRAEDVELAYRLSACGARFVFESRAAGDHYAQRTFASWRATAYQYGRYDVGFAYDRGQEWIFETLAVEFRQRHPLIRAIVLASLVDPRMGATILRSLESIATMETGRFQRRLNIGALSGLFNALYYAGVVDELRARSPSEEGRSEHVRGVLAPAKWQQPLTGWTRRVLRRVDAVGRGDPHSASALLCLRDHGRGEHAK